MDHAQGIRRAEDQAPVVDARDFKVGDVVENSYGYPGRVVRIEAGTMTIAYSERGHHWESKHDAEWFRRFGDLLRKR